MVTVAMSLRHELEARRDQLKNRIFMIRKYVENPSKWLGGKKFNLKDIPDIQKQVDETDAALWGISKWKESPAEYKDK
jgi:hypothetical protein